MTHEFSPRRGGIATYVEGMARAAVDEGIPTEVWTHGSDSEDCQRFPFPVIRLGTQGNQDWFDRLRLASRIRSRAHPWEDTILCLPEPGPLRMWMYQCILALPAPKAIVPVLHGSEVNLLRRWPHRRQLFKWFLDSSDKIGVVSRYVEGLLDEMGQYSPKVKIVPGAPLQFESLCDRSSRKENEPLQLLCLGRVQPRKGQLDLLKALAKMTSEDQSRFKVVIAGRFKDQRYLKLVESAAMQLETQVEIVGEVTSYQLNQILTETDLMVFPSRQDDFRVEGLGLVVLEAAIEGIPTLGSRHGGIPEAIRDGVTGWVCDTENSSLFAQKLLEIESNPEKCEACGIAARDWVREQFCYRNNLNELFSDWFQIRTKS